MIDAESLAEMLKNANNVITTTPFMHAKYRAIMVVLDLKSDTNFLRLLDEDEFKDFTEDR